MRVEAVLDTAKMRIGEQVKIDVYLSYDAKTPSLNVAWPGIGDTLTKDVEVIGTTPIDTTLPSQTKSTRIYQHQQITVSVYDSGYYAIPGFKFVINGDTTKPLYTKPLLLEVHTVPTDTSLAKTKDIKTVLEEPFNWKWYLPYVYWIAGAMILVTAIVLLIYYYFRKKKQVIAEPEKPKVPAHITALAALEKIREEQIWKEGRVKEYYSSISDTVRLYIEDRFTMNALESTTDEIMLAFRAQVVDDLSRDKLRQLLSLSDLAKFAKLIPTEQEHEITLRHAFDFVNGTKRDDPSDSVFAAPDLAESAGEEQGIQAAESVNQENVVHTPAVDPVIPAEKVKTPSDAVAPVTKYLIIVGGILLLLLGGYFVYSKMVDEPSFNETLQNYAVEMNKSLPRFIDRETRLDSTVVLPGRIFQYNYTLVRTDGDAIDKRAFLDNMEPGIFDNVRRNPAFAMQRENKVTMEYVYYDKNGRYLFNIRVRPEDY